MDTPRKEDPSYEEIDLRAVLADLLAQKYKLIACLIAGLILAATFLHLTDHKYHSEIVVAPAQQSGALSLGSLGNLGSLASLAGVTTPQGQGALLFSNYLEGVQSMMLANELAKNSTIMKTVFADEWNEKQNRWVKPERPLGELKNAAKAALGFPVEEWAAPDGARLRAFILEEITIDEPTDNPFARISFKHKDPDFAELFLNTMHLKLEEIIRNKEMRRAFENIEYLHTKMNSVKVVEYRHALAQALTEQEKQLMLAQSSAPFAADPLGKAFSSSKPTSPNPLLVYICAFLASVLAFVCYFLAWRAFGKRGA